MRLTNTLLKLPKRAESSGREKLIDTFVDIGPLFAMLSSADHQVVFGRRGTGKTHALSYLADKRERAGDVVAMVDLRNVGSSSGLYADGTVALAERATRLLVDTLAAIHDSLFEFFVDHSAKIDLNIAGPALDSLADAITQVRVVGKVETEAISETATGKSSSESLSISTSAAGYSAGFSHGNQVQMTISDSDAVRRAGEESLYVNFGAAGSAFRRIADILENRRLWVVLDEWSSVPLVLQPYLADLIRRSLLPVRQATVKLAAIEQRSTFQLARQKGDYIGIELGADIAADINLDDFMVFDNDSQKAKEFFAALVSRHVLAVLRETDEPVPPSAKQSEIMRSLFTEKRAIEEFVRASEGVPRDAINILALAAQRAANDPISVRHVRVAARNWYQRDKEKAASVNESAQSLLHWIIDQVIGERRARAFLLRSGVNDRLINSLYDARVIHVLKRAISSHDQPGVRYDVYKLDYGCYVDLITTAKAPQGLLAAGKCRNNQAGHVDVPPDDYRSIRRAILDLDEFYRGSRR